MTYSKMVSVLMKGGGDLRDTISEEDLDLLHMAVGVAGEAGEVLEDIKKFVIHNHPLDVEDVVDELGDLEFYLEGLRLCIGTDRKECLDANMKKLLERYPDYEYSDERSIERNDVS